MDLHEQIRRFIAERFLFDASAAIDPAQSLMKAGVLDSTGAMELVFFLEDALGVKVDDTDIVPANLDSINNLAAFVERKRTGRAA